MRRPTAKIATLAATGLLTSMLGAGALATPAQADPATAPSGPTSSVTGSAAPVTGSAASPAASPSKVKVKLIKLKKRPGKIRVVNKSTFSVAFAWGHAEKHKADGRILLAKKSSKVIRVRRTALVWVAVNRNHGAADVGYLRGIKLPKGQKPLPPSPRL